MSTPTNAAHLVSRATEQTVKEEGHQPAEAKTDDVSRFNDSMNQNGAAQQQQASAAAHGDGQDTARVDAGTQQASSVRPGTSSPGDKILKAMDKMSEDARRSEKDMQTEMDSTNSELSPKEMLKTQVDLEITTLETETASKVGKGMQQNINTLDRNQ